MRSQIAVFLACLSVLPGCDMVATVLPVGGGGADIYPMADGNKWVYDLYVNNVKVGTEIDEMSLVTVKDGLTTATVRVTSTLSSTGEERSVTQLLRKSSQDITQGSENGVSLTVLKLPLTPGKSWTVGALPVSVTGQEDVAVKAGSYRDCYRISGKSGDVVATNWYAYGIGLIKSQLVSGSDEIRQELASVRIN